MSAAGHNSIAASQLRAFVERIERIEADIKELNADKSEIYKELRGQGFDVKAVRQCIAARKLDTAEYDERTAIFGMYWAALTVSDDEQPSRVHVHVREERSDGGANIVHRHTEIQGSVGHISRLSEPAASLPDEIASTDDSSQRSGVSNPPEATLGASPAESDSEAISAPIPDEDEGIPAFLRKSAEPELNERCERPKDCKFSHHPQKITCSTCSTAWAIAQRKKAQVAA